MEGWPDCAVFARRIDRQQPWALLHIDFLPSLSCPRRLGLAWRGMLHVLEPCTVCLPACLPACLLPALPCTGGKVVNTNWDQSWMSGTAGHGPPPKLARLVPAAAPLRPHQIFTVFGLGGPPCASLAGGDLCREESGFVGCTNNAFCFSRLGDKVSFGPLVVVVSASDAPPFSPGLSNIHEFCPVYGLCAT